MGWCCCEQRWRLKAKKKEIEFCLVSSIWSVSLKSHETFIDFLFQTYCLSTAPLLLCHVTRGLSRSELQRNLEIKAQRTFWWGWWELFGWSFLYGGELERWTGWSCTFSSFWRNRWGNRENTTGTGVSWCDCGWIQVKTSCSHSCVPCWLHLYTSTHTDTHWHYINKCPRKLTVCDSVILHKVSA